MGIGTALLIWVITTLMVGALFVLSSRGSADKWILGVGLVVLALLLGFAVALPGHAPFNTTTAQASLVQPTTFSPTSVANPDPSSVVVAPTPDATVSPTASPSPSTQVATATVSPTLPVVSSTRLPDTSTSLAGQPSAIAPSETTIIADQPSAIAPSETETTIGDAVVTVIAEAANIRSAPEVGDNVVGQVVQGDELIVVQQENDWLLVRLGTNAAPQSTITTNEGWVARALVTIP